VSNKKAIFVTGGGSGIGRAIAQRFAGEGWFVGLGDISESGMKETAALIGNEFTSSHMLDVRDRGAWNGALDAFVALSGRMDVLANNAGIPIGGSIVENSEDEVTRCLDINLKGVIFGAQAAYPHLKKTAPGSCLLNTASAAGIYGSAGGSVYCATKFGVRGVTESLDGEWAVDGIKVRSLMPSFIDTPLLDMVPNAKTNEHVRARVHASGLEITPVEEVSEAAWRAVHEDRLHWPVGKTAKSIAFAARWLPGRVRKKMRGQMQLLGD